MSVEKQTFNISDVPQPLKPHEQGDLYGVYEEWEPISPALDNEDLALSEIDFLAQPVVEMSAQKAEIAPFDIEVATHQRLVVGALGALAAGETIYEGAKERFGYYAKEVLKRAGQLTVKAIGVSALVGSAVYDEAKYRTGNGLAKLARRSYEKGKTKHAQDLNYRLERAQIDRYNHDTAGANKHLTEIHSAIDNVTRSQFRRLMGRFGPRYSAKEYARADAKTYAERVEATPVRLDRTLLDRAATAKSAGDRKAYTEAIDELKSHVQHNERTNELSARLLKEAIVERLSKVVPREAYLTDPRNVLKLRGAIDQEVRKQIDQLKARPGPIRSAKERAIKYEVTDLYLQKYFGIRDLSELESNPNFPEKLQQNVFDLIDLPLDELRGLAGEAPRKLPKKKVPYVESRKKAA